MWLKCESWDEDIVLVIWGDQCNPGALIKEKKKYQNERDIFKGFMLLALKIEEQAMSKGM